MAHSRKPKRDDSGQHARFVEAARKLGCEEDEATFNEKLKRITSHKPKDVLKEDKTEEQ